MISSSSPRQSSSRVSVSPFVRLFSPLIVLLAIALAGDVAALVAYALLHSYRFPVALLSGAPLHVMLLWRLRHR